MAVPKPGPGLYPGRLPSHVHLGEPVRVGPYQILAAASQDVARAADARRDDVDLFVSLNEKNVFDLNPIQELTTDFALRDFGGVPFDWRERLETILIPRLVRGDRILAYCTASHGRTGTFLASLIALLESSDETPDPIAAVRVRHCQEAVETRAQAAGIFALRSETVPASHTFHF